MLEPDPELEALADTAEPEAVTKDAAAFGQLETGEPEATDGAQPQHVADDPDGGVPIEHVAAGESASERSE